MFERRPLFVLILGLNVCALIWHISVQEPTLMHSEVIGSGYYVNDVSLEDVQRYATDKAQYEIYQKEKQQHQQQQEFLKQKQEILHNIEKLYDKEKYQENHNNPDISGTKAALPSVVTRKGHFYKRKYKNKNKRNATSLNISRNNKRYSSRNIYLYNKKKNNKDNSDYNSNKKTLDLGTELKNATTMATPLVYVATLKNSPTKATAAAILLPENDLVQLIDLQNFSYLITQPACNANVEALILIHSAPLNYEKRAVIRETWASVAKTHYTPVRIIFLLGAVEDHALQIDLEMESARHGDIVQGTFVDNYRNMTYKHVMAFKWFLYNCAQAQILIKVDDDVYVNTPLLLRYIQDSKQNLSTEDVNKFMNTKRNINDTSAANSKSDTNEKLFNAAEELFHQPKNLLFCERYTGAKVKRTFRSKWRVSYKDYANRYYPPYCPGYAIIYSRDVAYRLYTIAQQSKYFWIDDVHITGILSQKANITITTLKRYVLYANKTDFSEAEYIFSWHNISTEQVRELWRLHVKLMDKIISKSNYSKPTTTRTSSALVLNKTSEVDTDTFYYYGDFR
ncbi:lactosylceramide 1,3-N-acetyl-beta-D-glucosaminyltransferase [Teleopsis dalmanni]|uniref:lactosylceramide 1,3-N-acetyl-beta-D-glucosaminyltransferase n=1 Tax=Teleopsis dalmanni TaxID=139649 RepID=UPI0018CCDAB9|nr:lactosylceramide 1,3-N-acetyl-beta-D-glucosaminyltransferase [Teleopsis dalmanni]